MSPRPRVIHFVTGGGSGATKVALDLACGHQQGARFEPLLVLRRKRSPLPPAMQSRLTASGLPVAWVDEGPKGTTRRQLREVIAGFQPQVVVAHGFSEHLWGRQAAIAQKVPVVIHVEHNQERYLWWRRWAARALRDGTSATVCVSQGVAERVRELRLESRRLEVIHNGVDVARFASSAPGFAARSPDIAMLARFARQKDQPTLIRAVQRLVAAGWTGRLLLGGAGSESQRAACERLVSRLGLTGRVEFLGLVANVVPLLHRCRVAVLSTRFEGLPLSLVESMAAGCAAVASEAPGVTDVIQSGVNGWLFPTGDDAALAACLQGVLAGGPAVEAVVTRGRADAPRHFAIERMVADYENLFADLLKSAPTSS